MNEIAKLWLKWSPLGWTQTIVPLFPTEISFELVEYNFITKTCLCVTFNVVFDSSSKEGLELAFS